MSKIKTARRISALLIAFVLAFSLAGVALASDTDLTNFTKEPNELWTNVVTAGGSTTIDVGPANLSYVYTGFSSSTAAETGVSITDISVTSDGNTAVTSGQVGTEYQVVVSVRNDNAVYSINPSVTLYEVGSSEDTQIGAPALLTTLSIASPTSSAAISWTPLIAGSHTLRAVVTGDMNGEPITPIELTKSITIAAADGSVPYDGTQTGVGPYSISTAGQLVILSDKVKNGAKYTGTTFVLTNDILNLSSTPGWAAIGSSSANYFGGIFDGGNHTIYGININNATATNQGGLFLYINGATIKNLTVSGTITAQKNVGGFVYTATNSKFINCTNDIDITLTAGGAGGFVSQATGIEITNSYNTADIKAGGPNCAGFVSNLSGGNLNTNKLISCNNRGTITGTSALAGILGQGLPSGATIIDCTNEASGIISSASGAGVGGIVGSVKGTISGCVNDADITGYQVAAGIVGGFQGEEISNCINNGDITVTTFATGDYAGGIVASMQTATATISKCYNYGDVKGPYRVGGLIGSVNSSSSSINMTVSECYNRGDVSEVSGILSSDAAYIGGLIGWTNAVGSVAVDTCYNSGVVSSQMIASSGGLFGYVQTGATGSFSVLNCYNAAPVSGKDLVGGLIGSLTSTASNPTATITLKNCYSAASTITGASSSAKAGIGIGELSKYTSSSPFTVFNVFAQKYGTLKAIGSDVNGAALDTNLIQFKTAAQLSDPSFLAQIGGAYDWFSQEIFGTGSDAQEYDEDAYNQYAAYYGDYGYPILVKLCEATPNNATRNVQVLGAQYMTVRFGDVKTYSTTVIDNGTASFTITSDYPDDITVGAVTVGSTALTPENGVYTLEGISADTVITVAHTGNAPDLPSEDSLYPVAFSVKDSSTGNLLDGSTITVTDKTPNESGVYSLVTSTYAVSISKDGYRTVNGTFDVTNDMSADSTNTIYVTLTPSSSALRDVTLKAGNSGDSFNIHIYNGDIKIDSFVSGIGSAYNSKLLSLPDGDYSYIADGASGTMGGGPLIVDGNKTVTLRFVNFSDQMRNVDNVAYTMTVTSADGNEIYTPGSSEAMDGGSARGWFVLPASEYGEAYKYTFLPISTSYWGSYGTTYLYITGPTRNFTGQNLSDNGRFLIAQKTTVTITAPADAALHLYHRVKFYEPLEELTAIKTDNGNGTATYTYDAPNNYKLHYELSLTGYVKKAAAFTAGETGSITIALSDLTPVSEAASDITTNKYDSDILTNAPNSKYIELSSGQRFDLYLFRSWQASDSITGNYYVEPDYHFDIVSGDSVQITDPYYAGATIEPVSGKSGISIIRITYDALDFNDVSGNSYLYSKLYEKNTAILVVNVNPAGSPTTQINTGIGTLEHETQYFARSINNITRNEADQYATYTFAPTITGSTIMSVAIHAPIGSKEAWTDNWQTIDPNSDGSYTAKLFEGRSVIRFIAADGTEAYYVLKAAGLDITITGNDKVNLKDGQFVVDSDVSNKLTITFSGLQMPLPKLGAIYNPGYDYYSAGTTYAAYTLFGTDTGTSSGIKSANSQYDISTINAISLSFSSPDTYALSGGRLHTTYYGSSCGSYINITKGGDTGTQATYSDGANTTEDKSAGLYGSLPNITFKVTGIPDTGTAHTVTITAPADLKNLTVRNHNTGYKKAQVSASSGTYTYSLYDNGGTTTYDYFAERAGYLTKVGSFTVSDSEVSVDITDGWTAVSQSGAVTVSVVGTESVPVSGSSETIAASPADLASEGYVTYNHGGYTVLHALVDALTTNSAAFTCSGGVLAPTITVTGTVGGSAGWICEVNGKVVSDYANVLVNDGDKVVFYYNQATSDAMRHAWFTQTAVSAAKDGSASLTLMSTPVNNDGTEATALAGASVFIDGNSWGTTDSNGNITLSGLTSLAIGAHEVTAQKKDAGDKNTLTFARATLTITKAAGENTDPNKVTVTFRLIGDTVHTAAYNGYINWIKTKSYTLDKNSTVGDLFALALGDAGMSYELKSNNNYVSSINAPVILGGYKLAEFSNGNKSGWMYTVNGTHPDLGLAEYTLSSGDEVIWHYVNNYMLETNKDGGTGQYVNPWLKAADVDPYAGMINESKDNASNSQIADTSSSSGGSAATVNLTPTATVTNGTANVDLSLSDLKDAIVETKENGGEIIIAPKINGTANKVNVALAKDALTAIAAQTDADLTVQTSVGMITLPNAVLDSITSQASGSTVTVSLGTVDKTTLTTDQQKAVGTSTVYDISVLSGSTHISSFGGNSVSISLPYALKDGESASGVTVWYMDDSGKLQQMTATYDKATGMATFTTTHLSYYLVGYSAAWTNPFKDVKSTDWFYDAVKYVSQNSLMSGTSTTTFDPNSNMTRAMLVTVLYRLEGKPAITGTSSFTDVKAGEWYTDAVIWAATNEIVGGYGGGLFGTNDSVTREQLAVILMNYAAYKKYDTTKTTELKAYTDATAIDTWATAAMKWAVAEDLVTGTTTTTLSPTGTASRAQVATILMRFIENATK
jgi:hypothetical protein